METVAIKLLKIGFPYPILDGKMEQTKYGTSVIVDLNNTPEDTQIRMFLLKWYADIVHESDNGQDLTTFQTILTDVLDRRMVKKNIVPYKVT